jgi:hypothetical protein
VRMVNKMASLRATHELLETERDAAAEQEE